MKPLSRRVPVGKLSSVQHPSQWNDGRGQPKDAGSGAAEKQLDTLGRELIFAACAYLDACSSRVPVLHANAIG
jgi:hypothetical protein